MKTNALAVRHPLISLNHVDVIFQDTHILRDICWQFRAGEHWAFFGASGSGKSTLLRLIRGDVWPFSDNSGKRIYAIGSRPQESPIGMKQKIAIVSAESQAAYIRNNWDISGEDIIATGLFDSIWLYERLTKAQREAVQEVTHLLRVKDLRKKSILAMSQGEARKILIGRAIVSRPAVLILDEFLNGLDIPSRRNVLHRIEKVAANGTHLLTTAHRTEDLFSAISHVLLLKEGRIIASGPKDAVLTPENMDKTFERKIPQKRSRRYRMFAGAISKIEDFLMEVKNADVYLDNKRILKSISWRMNKGEHWAILGRNGSGKSTLLKLLMGEAHPAMGGEIHRFGNTRREGLREIRKKIRCISPEIQTAYLYAMTGEEAVQSGFFSSIGLYDKVTQEQRKLARKWIEFLHLENLAGKKMEEMSYGEQTLILIARSMAGNPAMLVLDEPCSGLDNNTKADLLDLLDRLSHAGVNLILVTHHLDEIVPAITHVMVMNKGRIAAQGGKEEILQEERLSGLLGNE